MIHHEREDKFDRRQLLIIGAGLSMSYLLNKFLGNPRIFFSETYSDTATNTSKTVLGYEKKDLKTPIVLFGDSNVRGLGDKPISIANPIAEHINFPDLTVGVLTDLKQSLPCIFFPLVLNIRSDYFIVDSYC